jgi:hypothetical protein
MSEDREVSITVRVTTIRDGTNGISIAMPDRLVGEWTDSGAGSLTVTDEYSVSICGIDGAHRYLLTMPGTPLRGQQLSNTEATIVIRI